MDLTDKQSIELEPYRITGKFEFDYENETWERIPYDFEKDNDNN